MNVENVLNHCKKNLNLQSCHRLANKEVNHIVKDRRSNQVQYDREQFAQYFLNICKISSSIYFYIIKFYFVCLLLQHITAFDSPVIPSGIAPKKSATSGNPYVISLLPNTHHISGISKNDVNNNLIKSQSYLPTHYIANSYYSYLELLPSNSLFYSQTNSLPRRQSSQFLVLAKPNHFPVTLFPCSENR